MEKAVPLELGIYKVKFLICNISFFLLLQALLGKNRSSAPDLTILPYWAKACIQVNCMLIVNCGLNESEFLENILGLSVN